MNTKVFEDVFNDLGLKYQKQHLLYFKNPKFKLSVSIYYNQNRAGTVYFTTDHKNKDRFPRDLWCDIPNDEIKNKDRGRLNIYPKANKMREAFEKLIKEELEQINAMRYFFINTNANSLAVCRTEKNMVHY